MELDHVFVMVEPGAQRELERLGALGLVESYRRVHPGQGTENVCYGFDNAYLELLWLRDEAEARSPLIRRTHLAERAAWQREGTSPFGVAWRASPDDDAPFATWPFTPPYLPPGMSIPVAIASDDPRLPLLFRSPGLSAPTAWPEAQRGALQRAAGLTRFRVELGVSPVQRDDTALRALVRRGVLTLVESSAPRLDLVIERADAPSARLRLPTFEWLVPG